MPSMHFNGLSQAEAARRLRDVGPNELPQTSGRGLIEIIAETMREPMFLLLLGAAMLYMVLGDLGEGLFLFGGALASIGLVIFQEARSERALAALRELSQPHARVIRDGQDIQIPARELVPEDLLLVGEGERIPADGVLIGGSVLSVDESTLTGESAPVSKRIAAEDVMTEDARPGAVSSPYVFSGTLSVAGQGIIRVTRTGPHSALGQISASLAQIGQEATPLQQAAGRLVTLLGVLALVFCGIIALAYGLLRDDWVAGALAGVTVAIALIPEEFPMVLAVFMALGAWRLASHRVLVRRSAVIEALGGATVLCVDKTGTLTENQMRVARIWTGAEDIIVRDGALEHGPARDALEVAALASATRPVDPMDRAICAIAPDAERVMQMERAWPLRPEMMAVVQVWRSEGEERVAAAKGAPEAIFQLCRLPPEEMTRLGAALHDFANEGLRVLGIASRRQVGALPDKPEDVRFEFRGLIGFLDPLRADATAAIQEARSAGLKVIMITGDHPATALAIARSAGIEVTAGVVLGAEIARQSPTELGATLRHARVFARIAPEQKLMIVEALKANDEIVAMTGDGVNDAPALEAAHIGIAMGKRGTDVAREAADLVLSDDSFASIVGGVRLGRRIFTNLRRALTYITAIHVPIAGLALAPILFGMPPLLFPMHVVLLELAIDPICALVFEGEPSERAAMQKPPRPRKEALFGPHQLAKSFTQGLGVLIGVFGLYAVLLQQATEPVARGGAFIALVLANLVLALADAMANDGRVLAPHRRVFWSIAGALLLLLASVFAVPPLASIFRVAAPDLSLVLVSVMVALVSGAWLRAGEAVLARIRSTSAANKSDQAPNRPLA
ncbi:MAG: cation-translocating P-type ATPase [Hyphomonadaceae bacterium]|nr:cation-translocating P-type ATPase [Hyphomonadaceae bacterium]